MEIDHSTMDGRAIDSHAHDAPIHEPSAEAGPYAITTSPVVPPLAAEAVTVGYGQVPVLTEFGVSFDPGEVTALLGPNGSGKSTLLAALCHLLTPSVGAVLLDGASIARMPTKVRARHLALVAQSAVIPEAIDVRTLVSYGRYPYRGPFGTGDAAGEQVIADALRLCQLDDLEDRPVDALSGGQRQRVWLACALAQQTPWLLADEPTTYLDLGHQTEVLRLLHRLHTDHGRGLVMVLHDLSQAAQYADRIIVLDHGQIVADGPPGSVITEELLAEVYHVEARLIPHPVNGLPTVVPLP
ncbi:ABC transporter ATP-binding protein [Nonomuraea sp. JJY05]|uniref:ABC transporter ATP-binding protein n=1 Tax=Nonomuraea sp. JJY05 TaxID=3350255 RepID=UPI00373E612E